MSHGCHLFRFLGKWSTYTPSFHILETTDPLGLVVITQLPGGLIVYDSLQQYAQKKAESSAEACSRWYDANALPHREPE